MKPVGVTACRRTGVGPSARAHRPVTWSGGPADRAAPAGRRRPAARRRPRAAGGPVPRHPGGGEHPQRHAPAARALPRVSSSCRSASEGLRPLAQAQSAAVAAHLGGPLGAAHPRAGNHRGQGRSGRSSTSWPGSRPRWTTPADPALQGRGVRPGGSASGQSEGSPANRRRRRALPLFRGQHLRSAGRRGVAPGATEDSGCRRARTDPSGVHFPPRPDPPPRGSPGRPGVSR